MNKSSLVLLSTLFLAATSCTEKAPQTESKASITESIEITSHLNSWQDAPKARVMTWIDAVTNDQSPDFIPEADRIAVFDNDGTLWTEQPYPFQLQYTFDYLKANWDAHPEWANNPELKAASEGDLDALKASGMKGLLAVVETVHTGMTSSEFTESVQTWADTATNTHFNKKYTEIVYQPMMELLDVLRENGFKTFIVSGGGADFMRAFAEEIYGIPPYQVIGSYGDVKYEVVNGQPVLTKIKGDLYVDDKAGKPQAIHRFIGKVPVFCGGNSDGDQAMMEYTTGSAYNSLCMIVRHTDADREYAYELKTVSGHLETALVEASEKNWMVVDMKTDWKKVFAFEK